MDPGSSVLQPCSSRRPSADGEEGVFMMTLRDKLFEQYFTVCASLKQC